MKIVLKKSDASEPYTFSFMNDEAKMLVKSENYAAKKSCLNGIESVKKNSQLDERIELCESKNAKFYFNVKASNGQVVATSALFATTDERTQAIATLKAKAPTAVTEDLTD